MPAKVEEATACILEIVGAIVSVVWDDEGEELGDELGDELEPADGTVVPLVTSLAVLEEEAAGVVVDCNEVWDDAVDWVGVAGIAGCVETVEVPVVVAGVAGVAGIEGVTATFSL